MDITFSNHHTKKHTHQKIPYTQFIIINTNNNWGDYIISTHLRTLFIIHLMVFECGIAPAEIDISSSTMHGADFINGNSSCVFICLSVVVCVSFPVLWIKRIHSVGSGQVIRTTDILNYITSVCPFPLSLSLSFSISASSFMDKANAPFNYCVSSCVGPFIPRSTYISPFGHHSALARLLGLCPRKYMWAIKCMWLPRERGRQFLGRCNLCARTMQTPFMFYRWQPISVMIWSTAKRSLELFRLPKIFIILHNTRILHGILDILALIWLAPYVSYNHLAIPFYSPQLIYKIFNCSQLYIWQPPHAALKETRNGTRRHQPNIGRFI